MDKSELKQLARKLRKPSLQSYNNYVDQTQLMLNDVLRKMKAAPDYEEKVGDNMDTMDMNLTSHTQFMSSLFLNYDVNVFIETILWVYRTYMARGVQDVYWLNSYDIWLEVIKQKLSPASFDEIKSFYLFMQQNHSHFVSNAQG